MPSMSHPSSPMVPYYSIDLPRIPQQYENESMLTVLPDSPLTLRKEVERFAYYFRREFRYDWIPFLADETEKADGVEGMGNIRPRRYTGYLFAADERRMQEADDFTEYADLVWVGACYFSQVEYEELDNIAVEELGWAWLHPYFRDQGILSSHWERLRGQHGDFSVLPPLSHPMRQFLLRHNKDSMWYPAYEGKALDFAAIKAKLLKPAAR